MAARASGEKSRVFGLLGTITRDFVCLPSGRVFSGLGGILYQAAALCGLGQEVWLFSNLGAELWPIFEKATRRWAGCRARGVRVVPGPGNRVHLRYPRRGERVEVLESHVPPFNPASLLRQAPRLDFLIAVINSGRDFSLRAWRCIVSAVKAPIWLDIHSLPLSFVLGQPRRYQPLTGWKAWVKGISYLQANQREVASMLGQPAAVPSLGRLEHLAEEALGLGLVAVYLTLGKRGVLVVTGETCQVLPAPTIRSVVDTTGCGDVFCAATAVELARGADPLEAARLGVRLAARAARVAGVEKTYTFIRGRRDKSGHSA